MPMYRKSLIALVLLIGVISGIIFFVNSRDEEVPIKENSASVTEPKEQGSEVAVYITGEVSKPGVVLLSSNSRVADAIKACGDFTVSADRQKINLAQRVKDGMEIQVPSRTTGPEAKAKGAKGNAKAQADDDKVNINTASLEELKKIPGIGPSTAQKIIDYREGNGNFAAPEDLQKIKGIGKAKFEKIQDKIRV